MVWMNCQAIATCAAIKVLIIVIVCLYSGVHFGFYSKSANETSDSATNLSGEAFLNETNKSDQTAKSPRTIKQEVVKQPSCPSSYMWRAVLQEILQTLYVKREMCTPQDIHNIEKHRIPKPPAKRNETSNPRGTIVVYFSVGLLLASLVAAFLESVKARGQSSKKQKATLTRKCSLADLTVLRHNRKELVRRESVLEGVEHPGSLKTSGRKVSRPPLRLE